MENLLEERYEDCSDRIVENDHNDPDGDGILRGLSGGFVVKDDGIYSVKDKQKIECDFTDSKNWERRHETLFKHVLNLGVMKTAGMFKFLDSNSRVLILIISGERGHYLSRTSDDPHELFDKEYLLFTPEVQNAINNQNSKALLPDGDMDSFLYIPNIILSNDSSKKMMLSPLTIDLIYVNYYSLHVFRTGKSPGEAILNEIRNKIRRFLMISAYLKTEILIFPTLGTNTNVLESFSTLMELLVLLNGEFKNVFKSVVFCELDFNQYKMYREFWKQDDLKPDETNLNVMIRYLYSSHLQKNT